MFIGFIKRAEEMTAFHNAFTQVDSQSIDIFSMVVYMFDKLPGSV